MTHNVLECKRLERGGGEVPGSPALGEVDQARAGRGAHQQAQQGVAVHLRQLLPTQAQLSNR